MTGRNSGSRSIGDNTQTIAMSSATLRAGWNVWVAAEPTRGHHAGGQELGRVAQQPWRQTLGQEDHDQPGSDPQGSGDDRDLEECAHRPVRWCSASGRWRWR